MPDSIEYLRAWSAHCQLFWSRLQTAAILHSGVLVGWYNLKNEHLLFKRGILFLGVFLSVFIISVMVRDAQYLKTLEKKCGETFPYTGHDFPKGRLCGFIIVITFPVIELLLLGLGLTSEGAIPK